MTRFQSIATILVAAILANDSAIASSEESSGVVDKITQAATDNRTRLAFDGKTFSGPAYDKLVAESKEAQFLLIGEEHGIAENPLLAAQLFVELSDDGYEHLAIEISPTMATVLDRTLYDDGIDGLRALFARRGGEPAFFGMDEEAELIAAARQTSKRKKPVLLGVDYEVASDPILLEILKEKRKPKAAANALDALIAASDAAWAKYYETSGPQFLFSFSGDPALVRSVKEAWPGRDQEAETILNTLEETLEINKLWVERKPWESNARRAAHFRSNFLQHWEGLATRKGGPKIVVKLGASHLVRGRNMVGTFDLGTLLPEIAALHGEETLSLLVLPGAGSMTAVLDPTTWTFREAPGKDGYAVGVEAVTAAAYDDAFTLIDLRPLRQHITPRVAKSHGDLARIIHGFDMMLIFTGSTAAGELVHDAPSRAVE